MDSHVVVMSLTTAKMPRSTVFRFNVHSSIRETSADEVLSAWGFSIVHRFKRGRTDPNCRLRHSPSGSYAKGPFALSLFALRLPARCGYCAPKIVSRAIGRFSLRIRTVSQLTKTAHAHCDFHRGRSGPCCGMSR